MDACARWMQQEQSFAALVVVGDHGSGKTQLLMQARAQFERHCRVLHVRCREHERAQKGALLRRIFAQLCGHDVWPSLQYIVPMLYASDEVSNEGKLTECELKLLLSYSAFRKESSRALDDPESCLTLGRVWSNSSGADHDDRTQDRLSLIIDDITHAVRDETSLTA